MDDLKKNNVLEYITEDLNCKCVVFKTKNKKTSKKKLNRLARRRLKNLDHKELKIDEYY